MYILIIFLLLKRNLCALPGMSYKGRYDHTHNIFIEFVLLKLPDIIYLQTILFVHKSIYSLTLNHGFTIITHNATRRQNLRTPLCRTSHCQQSVIFRGTNIWNSLPLDYVNVPNVKLFKSKVISQIFNRYKEIL